ncbi:MAG TPA: tetratricopeptide repeat protein [Pirellulales bacterium]|nr:tetratricopeptide repeat protein [Pirellulales bacterium]
MLNFMRHGILFLLLLPSLAQAQQHTSAIMASRNRPDLRIADRSVGKLNDLDCVIEHYQGDWAWVRESTGQAGWVKRTEVVPMDEATDYFTRKIRQQPAVAEWYNRRAAVRHYQGELDSALADITEAILLDPKAAPYHNSRGNIFAAKHDYERALADYNAALRLDPNFAAAWNNAGSARFRQGNYQKALEDYDRSIRIEPNDALIYGRRAWILATAGDAKVRDGKKAVESARHACELTAWQEWGDIDTLAAAYAEAGDFTSAVKYAKRALEKAPPDDAQREEAAEHLQLFEAGKPVRDLKVTRSSRT